MRQARAGPMLQRTGGVTAQCWMHHFLCATVSLNIPLQPPHGIAPSPRKQSTRCPAAVQIGHSDSTSGSAHQPLQAGARSKMLKTSGQSMPRLSAPACTTSHTPTPTAAPAAKRGVANGVSVTNGTVTARDFMAAIARAESPDELLLALVQHARCADAMAVNALLSRLVKLHERRLLAMQARPAPPPNSGGTVAAAASAGPVASSPRPCVSTSTMPTLASKPQPAVNMASGAVQASYAYGHAAMQVDAMRTPPSPVQSQPSLSSSAPPGPMSWSEDVCLRLVRAALPVVARLVPSMQPRQAAGVMWSLARMPRAWLPPHGAGGGAGADASVTSVAAANIQSESHGSSAGSSTGAGCGCWAVSVLAGQLTEQLLRHQGVAKGQVRPDLTACMD